MEDVEEGFGFFPCFAEKLEVGGVCDVGRGAAGIDEEFAGVGWRRALVRFVMFIIRCFFLFGGWIGFFEKGGIDALVGFFVETSTKVHHHGGVEEELFAKLGEPEKELEIGVFR